MRRRYRPPRTYGKEYVCPECKQPCDAVSCDDGIGHHEFWGAKCNDSQPYIGSDCCWAELDDADLPNDNDDYGDYLYEQAKDRQYE